MSADDKAPPRGALEEAVALVDALISMAHRYIDDRAQDELADIESRRAALEPRLAKRRDNQAKGRGDKP